jgi:hypothetical protein
MPAAAPISTKDRSINSIYSKCAADSAGQASEGTLNDQSALLLLQLGNMRASQGVLRWSTTFLSDEIAPSAAFDGQLTLGRDNIQSTVHEFSSENIISPRIRSQISGRLTVTTDRSLRYAGQAAIHGAFSEKFVVQSFVSATKESPNFEAVYGGGGLDYEATEKLTLSVSGRYYTDTGETENSLIFSTATPGVESVQIGIGLRFQSGQSSFKLSLAPYFSENDPIQQGTDFFQDLYSDRTWGLAQIAFSRTF